MRKSVLSCAAIASFGVCALPAQAQHLPPYHPSGATGEHRHEERSPDYGTGVGHFYGGPPRNGISYPGYWTYNRFSNLGFGGLNWYYGPLGGYSPYISTPYANTSYGYPNFGPYYSYVPLAPVVRQSRPWQDPFNVAGGGLGMGGNAAGNAPAQGRQPPPQPVQPDVKIFKKSDSADAVRRSIHFQAQGDDWFAKQNYLQAYGHYKQAITAAPSRMEPRFRMALALAATRNYTQAVEEIKRAMRLDANWPTNGAPLDDLFGAGNILSKNAVLHKLGEWVGEDIRDPDRLFLMGVFLHFNDDVEKSRVFFEAATALSPEQGYAQLFLDADAAAGKSPPAEEPRPGLIEDPADPTPAAQAVPKPRANPKGPAIPGLPGGRQPEEPRPRPLARAARPSTAVESAGAGPPWKMGV